MNRRSFLRALGLGAAGVAVAPYLPALVAALPAPDYATFAVPTKYIYGRLTFKGLPLLFDEACPAGRVYFVNALNEEMRLVTADMARRALL